MDFFQKRDAAGAEYAMAIHMHHGIDVLELAGTEPDQGTGKACGQERDLLY